MNSRDASASISKSRLPEQRLVFIDAWRGFAALGVFISHLYSHSPYLAVFEANIPKTIIYKGSLGVEIFFVISGFVMAYSLREVSGNVRGLGAFILRRQLRLDPPYWTVLLITLALAAIRYRFGHTTEPFYTTKEVAANTLYLQNLLGFREILSVAWTLCIEIQFYLTYMVMLGVSLWLGRKVLRGPRGGYWVGAMLLIITGALSLWVPSSAEAGRWWFFPAWHDFAIGALVCWTLERRVPVWTCAVSVVAFLVAAIILGNQWMLTASLTAFMFFAVGFAGNLHNWLKGPVVQYFGRISYSLYLVHVPIGCVLVMGIGEKVSGPGLAAGLVWAAIGGIASVGAAHVLHTFVERPSMQFAKRFRGRGSRSTARPVVVTVEQAA